MFLDFLYESNGYKLVLWQFFIVCFFFVIFIQIIGSILFDFLIEKNNSQLGIPSLLKFFFEQSLGIAFLMILSLILAFFKIFNPISIGISLIIFLFLLKKSLKKQLCRFVESYSKLEINSWIVIAVAGCAVFFDSWRFPGHWDDVSYHLALAKSFVEHGDLSPNEWLRFPYFPAFGQLFFALGLMVDASLAQWLANWPTVLVLVGLMGLSQYLLGNSLWGIFAWIFYLRVDFVEKIAGYAYLDMLLALYITAAAIAVVIWIGSKENEKNIWIIICGIMAGISAGLKLHGLVISFVIGLSIIIFSDSFKKSIKNGLIFGLISISIFSFWYIRSYYFTGDPVHPSGGAIFGYYLWSESDLNGQLSEQATHGVPKEWKNFFLAFSKINLQYLLFALLAPLMLVSQNKKWLSLWFLSTAGIIFWFWVSQVDRYLMPILPIASLLCVLPFVTFWNLFKSKFNLNNSSNWFKFILIVPLVLVFSQLHKDYNEWRARPIISIQKESKDEIFLLNKAKSISDVYGGKIINIGYENSFFYSDMELMGDWFGPAGFFKTLECVGDVCHVSASKMKDLMKFLGVRMLVINEGRWRLKSENIADDFELIYRHGQGALMVSKSR